MVNHKFKLTSFHIDNFRIFDSETEFDIEPITILTGTNSSGKSSVTKALALLVKSYKRNGLKSLDFMTSNLNLTGFNSIKNSLSGKEAINFKLVFETKENFYELNLSFTDDSLSEFSIIKNNVLIQAKGVNSSFLQLPESLVDKEKVRESFSGLREKEIDEISDKILSYLRSDYKCHKTSALDWFEISDNKSDFAKKHQKEVIEAMYYLNYSNSTIIYNPETKKEEEHIIYTGENPLFGDLIQDYADAFGLKNSPISDVLSPEALENWSVLEDDLLPQFFGSFKFIGAVRATQQVIYSKHNSPEFFDIICEYMEEGKSEEANWLLKKWMVDEFKLFKLKEDERIKDVFQIREVHGLGYLVQFFVNGMWTDLASLGYGVTQLFPIILMIATKPNGNFVIEEPEANLHPALQSKLADFFLDITNPTDDLGRMMVKLGTRSFIIETHSEYLIRKFQFLTANPKSNCSSEDTVIYYFYPPDGIPTNEKQVKKININKSGSLSDNFGEGFTDEATSWKFELLNLHNIQQN